MRRRELPFAGVAVILELDGAWDLSLSEDGPPERFGSFVGGLIDRPAFSANAGPTATLQFNLTPLGALAVFGVPGSELAGRIVEFSDLVPDAHLLIEELAGQSDWPARYALLDTWLTRRFAGAGEVTPDVEWAWRRIVGSAGAIPMSELQRELGCSSRHLSARFGEHVGMTPKRFARMVRFEHAVQRLRAGDEELGVIAADCGYYDQAHFNRDFRAFAGVAPGAL